MFRTKICDILGGMVWIGKAELAGATGITHRVAWKQGILGVVKWFLKVRGGAKGKRAE